MKTRDYSDSTPDVSFYYDGRGLASVPANSKGKTTKVTSSVSENRYTSFDNFGRLLVSQQITDGQTYQSSLQYDAFGKLVSETYPSGRTVFYTTDSDGELESVWGQKSSNSAKLYLNQIKYNSAGAIEKMRLGNSRWESAVYNERGQITEIGLGYSNTDKSLLKLENFYGTNTQNNGSLRQQKISYRGLANQLVQDYAYDDLNRLKSSVETVAGNANPVWKQTFDYDRYGNRVFDAAQTTTLSQAASPKTTNPSINTSNNRLKKDQDGDTLPDYIYDKAGNLTLDAQNQRFVFDAENRMKEFFHSANNSNEPDARYFYDGEGRRVKKISGNRAVIFVYNSSSQLVAEYDSQLASNPQISFITTDHLGSPRVITDGRGAVIARHDYMAFGSDITETIGSVGGRTAAHGYNSADSIRQQYTGYEHDDESNLEFAQARYYNSSHGRFTSVDPLTASATIRDPQTFNRYSYVLNSPYKFTDPLGLLSTNTAACGTSCVNTGSHVDGTAFRDKENAVKELNQPISDSNKHSSTREAEGRPISSQEITTEKISSSCCEDISTEDLSQINEDENSLRTTDGSFDPTINFPYINQPLERNPDFIDGLNKIWQMSGNGTTGVEASFNVNGNTINPEIVINSYTNEVKSQKITINVRGPNKTFAIVHVHPNSTNGNPSTPDNNYLNNGFGDTGIADKYGIKFYVLHKSGLRVYDPQTKKTTFISTFSEALKK